ncbi:MAG: histidinol-phosphatase [Rhodospirillales bacterium]|nr:histidinol-phosphatase [Rhodospirillales bacterium]
MSNLDSAILLAERMADSARPITLGYFRGDLVVEDKADASPVTVADRDVEAAMRQLIESMFPDHGIYGEEHGQVRLDAEYVWVLDPIDGTKSFITGKPLFGTLIALLRDGKPVLGVIDMPALDERWVGAENRPTTFNGRIVETRRRGDLAHAWLCATSPHMFVGGDADAFERLRIQCRDAIYGADCYAYGLIANGTVDVVCEASTQPYDYCAVVPVITGAGGVATDWQGKALGLSSDGRVLAAGDPNLHASAMAALE